MGQVLNVFKQPTEVYRNGLEYKLKEIQLRPKESLEFEIPSFLQEKYIAGISFGHRQDETPTERDYRPAYTRLTVLSQENTEEAKWRYWGGHFSGTYGAKFAEQRSRPEIDSLFEWPRSGHYAMGERRKKYDLIKPLRIKVENVGVDDLLFSSLSLQTISQEEEIIEDYVFSGKSNFGDPITMANRFYDGGQIYRGKFPGALRLHSSNGDYWERLPKSWRISQNRVYIPLKEGRTLTQIEVMCGDTKPDGVRNKDGGWGSLGNAKLSILIQKEDLDEPQVVAYRKNAPPQGVITASTKVDYKNDGHDTLILENRRSSSPLYIMAIRLRYEK